MEKIEMLELEGECEGPNAFDADEILGAKHYEQRRKELNLDTDNNQQH